MCNKVNQDTRLSLCRSSNLRRASRIFSFKAAVSIYAQSISYGNTLKVITKAHTYCRVMNDNQHICISCHFVQNSGEVI